MTERKSTPNEYKQSAFHAAQLELKANLNSLVYLDKLQEEVIPNYAYEMVSCLNLFSRGNSRQQSNETPQTTSNQTKEMGMQTDPDIEETERITWRHVVNEVRKSQQPNAQTHMATNTDSEKLLPAILDRGVIAALTGDDNQLRNVRKAVMTKKQEDEER